MPDRRLTKDFMKRTWNADYVSRQGGNSIPVKGLRLEVPWYFGFLTTIRPFKPTDVVLEIGSGEGNNQSFLHPFVKYLHGIDISEVAIETARKRFAGIDNVHFRVGADLTAYPDEIFDVIYSITVFQHMLKADGRDYMTASRSKLKVGGLVFFQYFWSAGYSEMEFADQCPAASWSAEEIRQAAQKAGLRTWWQKQVAEGYFKEFVFSFSQPHLIERLHLSKESCILEVGCGYGRETSQFVKISGHVQAVDLADVALELTRKHAPGVVTASYDGWTLPYPDKTFNLVYACFVIQHMSKHSSLRLIAEALRVLKPSGAVLFEFFECAHYSATVWNYLSGGSIYNNSYTLGEAEELIRGAGGVVRHVHSVGYGVLPSERFPTFNHWIEFGRKV